MANAIREGNSGGFAIRKLVIWLTGGEETIATSPTITGRAGAPSDAEPNGSIYLRTDAATADLAVYSRIGGAWVALKGAT